MLIICIELNIDLFNISWGLGIGDWGLGPNPQSPIPNIILILNFE